MWYSGDVYGYVCLTPPRAQVGVRVFEVAGGLSSRVVLRCVCVCVCCGLPAVPPASPVSVGLFHVCTLGCYLSRWGVCVLGRLAGVSLVACARVSPGPQSGVSGFPLRVVLLAFPQSLPWSASCDSSPLPFVAILVCGVVFSGWGG